MHVLTKALDPFASKFFNVTTGRGFRAQLLMTPMEESATYFLLPRRILKLYPDDKTKPGDLIKETMSKKLFFAAENGVALYNTSIIHRTMKLFEVTHKEATLIRKGATTDTVTGLPKKDSGTPTIIPATIEFTKVQEDEMRIGADLVRVISNYPMAVNDKVNQYTVLNVEYQIGLYFATARNMH